MAMSKDYVTQIDGAYRIAGTRISLDSVVYAFLDGQPPESIIQSFPLLTLEQVYGKNLADVAGGSDNGVGVLGHIWQS